MRVGYTTGKVRGSFRDMFCDQRKISNRVGRTPALFAPCIEPDQTHAHRKNLTRDVLKEIRHQPPDHDTGASAFQRTRTARYFRTYHNLAGLASATPKEDAVPGGVRGVGAQAVPERDPAERDRVRRDLLSTTCGNNIRDNGLIEYSRDRQAPQEILPVHLYGIRTELPGGDFSTRRSYYLAGATSWRPEWERHPYNGPRRPWTDGGDACRSRFRGSARPAAPGAGRPSP